MDSKIVFLSYSHDSPAHQERVLGLAVSLRQDGVRAVFDQYLNGAPPQGWPRWTTNQVDRADRVIVVCTETYYRRFRGQEDEEPGPRTGADWEGALVTQALYDARSDTEKFVPVVLEAGDEKFIPEPIRSRGFFVLDSQAGYEALWAELAGSGDTGQPA